MFLKATLVFDHLQRAEEKQQVRNNFFLGYYASCQIRMYNERYNFVQIKNANKYEFY